MRIQRWPVLAVLATAACGNTPLGNVNGVLSINTNALNFGDNPVLTPASKTIPVANIGRGPLNIAQLDFINVVPAGSTAFTLDATGISTTTPFLGAAKGSLKITFSAPTEGTYSATLVLVSNDKEHGNVMIQLTGVATTAATVSVTPDAPTCLAFGNVCEDHSAILSATVTSTGTAPLLITSLGFSMATNAAFGSVGSWNTNPPLALAAHTMGITDAATDISVVFKPTQATISAADGSATGTLQIGTNDPTKETVDVCLTGTMKKAPVAVAQIANGGASMVAPGSTVMLDGSGSTDPNGDTLTYQWTLMSAPQGSAAVIDAMTATDVMSSITLDQPGNYVVGLVVSDSTCTSSQPATISIIGVLSNDLLVELIWDNPTVDLDLHVLPPGGTLYGPEDCWWNSPNQPQTSDGTTGPWGTGLAHNYGDVLEGFGPETVDIQMPADENYEAVVVYANANGAADAGVNATVEFKLYGSMVPAGQVTKYMTMPGTFPSDMGEVWNAAVITWPTGNINTSPAATP